MTGKTDKTSDNLPTMAQTLRHFADELDGGARKREQALQDQIEELQADVDQLRAATADAAQMELQIRDLQDRLRTSEASNTRLRDDLADAQEEVTVLLNRNPPVPPVPTAPTRLDAVLLQMQDVVTQQLLYVNGAGSGAHRAVDIRRRQLAKYSPAHDSAHGAQTLETAAAALLMKTYAPWPFPDRNQFDDLVASPERRLHAAALLMAASDVDTALFEVGDK